MWGLSSKLAIWSILCIEICVTKFYRLLYSQVFPKTATVEVLTCNSIPYQKRALMRMQKNRERERWDVFGVVFCFGVFGGVF